MQSPESGIPSSPEAQRPGGPGTFSSLIASYYGPALTALTFFLLTWLTWRKWPDILIDFGRELYVPWRLIQGEVLYRDLAYLNGPFSPYLNALWFRLFGDSFLTPGPMQLISPGPVNRDDLLFGPWGMQPFHRRAYQRHLSHRIPMK